MDRHGRKLSRRPWGELAGVIFCALALLVSIAAIATLWVEAGGNMSAPIDLGGRWGEGTLGAAVAAFSAMILVFALAVAFSTLSLLRRWPRKGRGTRR